MTTGNYIDIVLVSPMLYGLIMGIRRGLAKEVSMFIGPLAGIIVARFFADDLAQVISGMITWDISVCKAIAYILLFTLTAVIFTLFGRWITKFLRAISLHWLNRIGGGVFGCLKWVLLLSAILNGAMLINEKKPFIQQNAIEESYLFKPVMKIGAVAWEQSVQLIMDN